MSESPDALVRQIKGLSRLPDGEEKEGLKAIAREMLDERVERQEISDAFRQMLLRIMEEAS